MRNVGKKGKEEILKSTGSQGEGGTLGSDELIIAWNFG
jgi:hypothetical protein